MAVANTSNPYAAPQASVADSDAKGGRPLLVWVITIFLGFGIIVTVGSTAAALSGAALGEEFAAQMRRISPLDHIMSLTGCALSAWAMVELFRLKRRALPIFVLAFALGLAYFGLNMTLRPGYRAIFEDAGYRNLIIGWTINLAVIAYVWRLRARGILR